MSPARPQDLTRKELLKAEHGTLIKNFHGQPSIVLIYPNSYHIGMSNLGFQKMYCLFNEDPECVCERAFSHGYKTEKEMRSFENNRPLSDFDCVAFSISFENDYINILPALAAANIPLTITERSDTDPIIMAGGTAISINPEPVRTFFDVLFVGEADQSTPEILEALNKETRSEKLNALSQIDGCYLSSAISDCDSKEKQAPITADATIPDFLNTRISPQQLRKYKRKITKDLDQHPAQTLIHTRHTEFGDLSLIELQRGCEHGCKFCAECFVASPFRERSYTVIEKQISEGLKQRNTLGLVGTNLL
ncbi:hypothetical protein KKF63_07765, partial [bacterium]|nr:hypothetical protein [bacterium]